MVELEEDLWSLTKFPKAHHLKGKRTVGRLVSLFQGSGLILFELYPNSHCSPQALHGD